MTKNLTFEEASNETITDYFEELKLIVRALGHKRCFITDESVVSDFLPRFGSGWKENSEKAIKKAHKKLRTDLKPTDKLVKIAKRIRRENKKKENK